MDKEQKMLTVVLIAMVIVNLLQLLLVISKQL